jgi:hypothetical protein
MDLVEESAPSKTEKKTAHRGGTGNVETPASPARELKAAVEEILKLCTY